MDIRHKKIFKQIPQLLVKGYVRKVKQSTEAAGYQNDQHDPQPNKFQFILQFYSRPPIRF